jgi:hypothetical protein
MRRELSYEELRTNGYSMQPMEDDKDVWKRQEYSEVQDDRELSPRAGAIVSALGNYRRTHPIVNFQYKIGLFIKRLRYIISLFNRQDWSK